MIRELILRIINLIRTVVDSAIWIYVISSWFVNVHETVWKVNRFLAQFIEPLLQPVRKIMYPITRKIGIDFSPYVLALVVSWVMNILYDLVSVLIPF